MLRSQAEDLIRPCIISPPSGCPGTHFCTPSSLFSEECTLVYHNLVLRRDRGEANICVFSCSRLCFRVCHPLHYLALISSTFPLYPTSSSGTLPQFSPSSPSECKSKRMEVHLSYSAQSYQHQIYSRHSINC